MTGRILDTAATAAAWAALPPFVLWLLAVYVIDSMGVAQ